MKVVVADSSYVVEGLLKDGSLFEGFVICCPDYSLYEILNVVWKHQVLLKRIKDSKIIIDTLFDLISAQSIQFLTLREETIRKAYNLAAKTKMPICDVVFVALARELGIELKTFDKRQTAIFDKYSNRAI
ncbi:MAG: type II toxin-antitoxin system VapC family toxin [Candidatus Nitrosotenuis sp.]